MFGLNNQWGNCWTTLTKARGPGMETYGTESLLYQELQLFYREICDKNCMLQIASNDALVRCLILGFMPLGPARDILECSRSFELFFIEVES